MAALLARKERECLSYRALEEETGISRATLASWASRLRREGAANRSQPVAPFVELIATDPTEEQTAGLELVVGAHVVRVRPGFDPATLRRLLAALSGSC